MTKAKKNKTTRRALLFFGSIGVAVAVYLNVDFYNKDKCEWYLVPDLKNKELIEPGFVSLCARNYKIDRQKCYLQSTLALAEGIYNKPIRFSDMQIDEDKFPKMVVSAPPCSPEK
jgi:hypothetical protein